MNARGHNFEMTFCTLEFSQKTNEWIRFYYYDEFVRSFFGRIRGHQKVSSKLSDLYYILKIDSVVKKKEVRNNLLESAIKSFNVA